MTNEELEQIQTACHEWLRQPGTSDGSRMTIPIGARSRTVELEVKSLLTFDNVMIASVFEVETGVCYSTLIGKQGEPGEFIDTPLDMITSNSTSPASPVSPASLRPTQQHYRNAMEHLAETQRANEAVPSATETNAWIEKGDSAADPPLRFLLYTNEELLGYSLLERARANGRRSGRFHPSENYFEHSPIFESLTEAENDCVEANVREAYGIMEAEDEACRKRFNELSAQAAALKLYLEKEDGRKVEVSEVRLEDLSRYYNDHQERWLYVTLGPRR